MGGDKYMLEYEIDARFYYVDGSVQNININTDNVHLAIEDYKKKLTYGECIMIDTHDGKTILINSKNVVNIEFK